jgi:hypothetical protein
LLSVSLIFLRIACSVEAGNESYTAARVKARLWIEETKELDMFETEISWNLKGLVAIAIPIAVMKKSLAAAEPAIQFSETPHAENEPSIAVRGSILPPME